MANIRFDLDKILTDEILFYMENQNGDFLLDTMSAKVIKTEKSANYDKSRYIPLPGWDSNDGFRLMGKFALELKNPVIRTELSAALNCKRGVFRSFKNVLEQYPEAEKLWHSYKNKKMKDDIYAWYNALREEWGLEPVGGEPSEISEDISAIIAEDFIFREGKESDEPEVYALHAFCLEELKEKNILFKEAENKNSECITLAAQNADGEFCGYIRAVKEDENLHITRLEVKPEYRGMGIGKTLLSNFLAQFTGKTPETCVIFDLPAGFEYFSRALHIENFKPVMQRFTTRGE